MKRNFGKWSGTHWNKENSSRMCDGKETGCDGRNSGRDSRTRHPAVCRILAGAASFCMVLCGIPGIYCNVETGQKTVWAAQTAAAADTGKASTKTVPVETISIETVEDLLRLAENCAYDAWSRGKTVVLQNDISLDGTDFLPIPSFGGTWEGGGHVISGLKLTDSLSPAGLFGEVQQGAVIKNLKVQGSVTVSGSREKLGGIAGSNAGRLVRCTFTGTVQGRTAVGGIVGCNETTGEIYECTVEGTVQGEKQTGGIAGNNLGSVVGCTNYAEVNTVSVDPTIHLEDLDTTDFRFISLETFHTSSDTGGIAGYSSGMLINCINSGKIGYQHIGYNTGGIVGRSCGYVYSCVNHAEVYGRKDVGGIAGQLEPYVRLTISGNFVEQLRTELNELNILVNRVADNTDASTEKISARLSRISESIDAATDSARKLSGELTDYADDVVTEVNRASAIAADTIDRLAAISGEMETTIELLTIGLDCLENGMRQMSDAVGISKEVLKDIEQTVDLAADAVSTARDGMTKISSGLDELDAAVQIKDKEQVRDALHMISGGLSDAADAADDFSDELDYLISLFQNVSWTGELTEELREFEKELKALSASMKKIHDAVDVIDANIDVDWDKITSGADHVIQAINYFRKASEQLETALESSEKALDKISDGMKKLSDAVDVKDEEAVEAALKQLAEGVGDLADAMDAFSGAMEAISDILAELESWNDFTERFGSLLDAWKDFAETVKQAADAMRKISDALMVLSENVEVDEDLAGEGCNLVVEGFRELGGCMKELKEAGRSFGSSMDELQKGLMELREGIVVGDEKAIERSLKKINKAFGEIADTIGSMGDTIGKIADTMDKMKLWSDKAVKAASRLSDCFSDMADALLEVSSGVDIIENNVNVDWDGVERGLDKVRDGMRELRDATVSLEASLRGLGKAAEDLEEVSDALREAMNTIADAIKIFQLASDSMEEAMAGVTELFDYLAGVEKIQFPQAKEEIEAATGELFDNLKDLSEQLKLLNSEVTESMETLADDIREINELANLVINTFLDAIANVEDFSVENLYKDISEEDINSVTTGKAERDVNYGSIYGDINVGGVAGAMAMESDIDPEEEVEHGMTIFNSVYETRTILQRCVNYGSILSKKDCAGAVCGRMELGFAVGCAAYGSVESEDGNYIGGIAGYSRTKIRGSYAKCTLSGNNYIGGIIGYGNVSEVNGRGSVVSDCASLVWIKKYEQFAGAVAGKNNGIFERNYFVSDRLAGVDRVSYEGQAEPISYEELLKISGLPEQFRKFDLTFRTEDEILKTVQFDYGDSFDAGIYPEIPAVEGNYAYWDIDTAGLSNLRFDTVVTAQYKPYVISLYSGQRRGDGRNVFFAEGHFTDWDEFQAVAQSVGEGQFSELLTGFMSGVGRCVAERSTSELYIARKVAECWQLTVPRDDLESHYVRYLPEQDAGHLLLYVKQGGRWERLDYEEVGSYLRFVLTADMTELAVVAVQPFGWFLLGGVAAVVILAAVLAHGIRKKRRKR